MRPKRQASRAAQLHPQTQPAESDTEAITDAVPALAPPPKRTNTELNLAVLRRYCPDITHIVDIAPFAVLYTFSHDTQQWEKCGIEGTLFICQLTGARYNAIILNRKSLDNFLFDLVSADDVQVTPEFEMLEMDAEDGSPPPLIYGIWIFSDAETTPSTREVVAQTILSCALQAQIAGEGAETEMEGANGHKHRLEQSEEDGYGMDGTAQMQEQMEEEEAVAEQAGQKLDLMQLFGSTPAPSEARLAPETSAPALPPLPGLAPPARFTATADTDFFRKSTTPAMAAQPQQRAPPPTQQNVLLDLFKK